MSCCKSITETILPRVKQYIVWLSVGCLTSQQHASVSLTSQQHASVSLTSQQHASVSPTSQQHASVSLTSQQHASVSLTSQQHASVSLTSQQHASVSQGRICSGNSSCCHTAIEVTDQTVYLTQSQYTDTGPTSPNTDPITPGACQGSH